MINAYQVQKELINKMNKKRLKNEDIIEVEFIQGNYIYVGTSYFIIRLPKNEYFLKCISEKMDRHYRTKLEECVNNFLEIPYDEKLKVEYIGTLADSPKWSKRVALFQESTGKVHAVTTTTIFKGLNLKNIKKASFAKNKAILLYDDEEQVCGILSTIVKR